MLALSIFIGSVWLAICAAFAVSQPEPDEDRLQHLTDAGDPRLALLLNLHAANYADEEQ